MNKNLKTQESNEDLNISIKDVNIKELIPNVINDYIVTILDDHHTIVLPMDAHGSQFRSWSKGRGGIFSKDVLNYSLELGHGKYVLIKGETETVVARLISEEEELQFKTLKLIDGQIKDMPYMVLKNVKAGEPLAGIKKYVNKKEIEYEETLFIPIPKMNSSIEEEENDSPVKSISLFTD